MKRVCISIPVSEEVRLELSNIQDRLDGLFPVRWTDPSQMHITLCFMGNVSESEVENLCSRMREIGEKHASFDISLSAVDFGPPKSVPKFVWAYGELFAPLLSLWTQVEGTCHTPRPKGEERVPHITLGRIPETEFRRMEPEEVPYIREEFRMRIQVSSVEVMESILRPRELKYVVLDTIDLR